MRISNKVKAILRDNPKARNSDRELLLAYMEYEGMQLSPGQREIFRHMPSAETITRVRRKLQEAGIFPAAKPIKAERSFKAMRVQQNAPSIKPEKIENILEPTHAVQVDLEF